MRQNRLTFRWVQSSIKTRIQLLFDDFDDDETVAGLGKVSLQILAYQGCTSADTCSSVTPVELAPGLVSINGISKEILFENGKPGDNDYQNTGLVSTNMAMFVLMDSGPHFLQARFVLKTDAEIGGYGPASSLSQSDVNVFVDNYIIMVTRTA